MTPAMLMNAQNFNESPRSIFNFDPNSLVGVQPLQNQPNFRIAQIFQWIFERGATDFSQMTNLSLDLREALTANIPVYQSEVIREQRSSDGTIKLLLRWPDGATSECVLIPDEDRRTACISTQVGCPVGCVFCASGIDGLQRNLTTGQIVEQAMRVRQLCEPDERLSNIVFMGLGEPLANFQPTMCAVHTINAPWGMGIGARKITISTVGLPKQMKMVADEGLQVTLALSLHAPNDELRKTIIPWAERVTIESLIDAANYYFEKTRREITLEYILLGGLNDRVNHAHELAHVAKRMRSNINLIAYNPVSKLPYRRPAESDVVAFLGALRGRGVNAHVRRSRGLDIDAACGQLRRRESEQSTLTVVPLTVTI